MHTGDVCEMRNTSEKLLPRIYCCVRAHIVEPILLTICSCMTDIVTVRTFGGESVLGVLK